MCGRFTLTASAEALKDLFPLFDLADYQPHYNIAPSQNVICVRRGPSENQFVRLRWGLIPHWAKDVKIGYSLINARSETVAEKPAFRTAFRQRRCLILADGFFEWQKLEEGKQPHYIHLRDGRLFAFAGLWERWDKGDEPLESCSIITTQANDLMRPLHDRMPVILPEADFDGWLDPTKNQPDKLQTYLQPYPRKDLEAFPVSTLVNNPRNDLAACIKPLAGKKPDKN